MSRALDSRLLAEYRKRVSDPDYVARALNHVAGLLAEAVLSSHQPRMRGLVREHDPFGDIRLYN